MEKSLRSGLGMEMGQAYRIRSYGGILVRMWLVGVGLTYYGLYHGNNWESTRGWRYYRSRMAVPPDHPDYPCSGDQDRLRPNQYATENFDKANI